jgi:CSLREA domain-containing protein
MALACLHLVGQGPAPARAAPAATIYVDTTADEFDTGSGCSLREAIQAANTDSAFGGCTAGSGADTIVVPAGTYVLARTGVDEDLNATGDLDVRASLTISGAGAGQTVVDAAGIDRVFDLHTGADSVVFSGVTISGGVVTGHGGGINDLDANLTLSDTIVRSNDASISGGGVRVYSGTLTISGGQIFSNSAGLGGGIRTENGPATLDGGQVYSNTASNGGGVDFGAGGATVSGTHICSNTVTSTGGGIRAASGGTVTLIDVQIYSNTATTVGGGGIYIAGTGTAVTLSSGRVFRNRGFDGGGVRLAAGGIRSGGEIVSNTAVDDGGGVYLSSAAAFTLTAEGVVESNTCADLGGGFRVDRGSLWIDGGRVISNTASHGGGILVSQGALDVAGAQIVGNIATTDGGGLFNEGGSARLVNTTVSGNSSTASAGAGLYSFSGTTVLTFTTVASNSAGSGAGGIHSVGGTVLAHNTIVAHNGAANCAGTITSNDYNREDGSTCGFGEAHDLMNASPGLALLAYDTGTLIHRLTTGSDGIDSGLCVAGITTDQRGRSRPAVGKVGGGFACDIGAYEHQLLDYLPEKVYLPLVLRSY